MWPHVIAVEPGTAFYLAAQPDRTEVLRVLIEAGVDRD